jgi:hypothetical protein
MKQTLYREFLINSILLLTLLLVAACGSVGTTSTSTPAATTPMPTSTVTIQKTVLARSFEETLGPYMPVFKQQLAQGLHLTVAQLTQKIRAGQTLTALASAQGVSKTQLSGLVVRALPTSLAPLVKAGRMTPQELERLTRYLKRNPNLLDSVLAQ